MSRINNTISLADTAIHAQRIIDQYYLMPYSGKHNNNPCGIARYYHGGQHACGVAMLCRIFANLYRRYGYSDALTLTEEDVLLVQIAGLLHDSARQSEGKDLWDLDSAENCYRYLLYIGVSNDKAKLLAEAIANKDSTTKYYKLIYDGYKQKVTWIIQNFAEPYSKSIYQILIHDADCLEVLRVRKSFDAKYLDFFRLIAKDNPAALKELSYLICEMRVLQDYQGNGVYTSNPEIKKNYEHAENCYQATVADLDKGSLALSFLRNLYNKNFLYDTAIISKLVINRSLPPDADPELTLLMDEGKILARGIYGPEHLRQGKKKDKPETQLNVEIRKSSRQKGNQFRATSVLGYGTFPARSSGFLCRTDLANIYDFKWSNVNSGFGKKRNFKVTQPLNAEQVSNDLRNLLNMMQIGGNQYYYFKDPITLYNHTEVTATLYQNDYFAIFYSADRNPGDLPLAKHRNIPVLQAIYIQQYFEKLTGKKLPIYEYSANRNLITLPYDFDDNAILKLWDVLVHDRLRCILESNCIVQSAEDLLKYIFISQDKLKSNSISGSENIYEHYSAELKKKLIQLVLEKAFTETDAIMLSYANPFLTSNFSSATKKCLDIVLNTDFDTDFASATVKPLLIKIINVCQVNSLADFGVFEIFFKIIESAKKISAISIANELTYKLTDIFKQSVNYLTNTSNVFSDGSTMTYLKHLTGYTRYANKMDLMYSKYAPVMLDKILSDALSVNIETKDNFDFINIAIILFKKIDKAIIENSVYKILEVCQKIFDNLKSKSNESIREICFLIRLLIELDNCCLDKDNNKNDIETFIKNIFKYHPDANYLYEHNISFEELIKYNSHQPEVIINALDYSLSPNDNIQVIINQLKSSYQINPIEQKVLDAINDWLRKRLTNKVLSYKEYLSLYQDNPFLGQPHPSILAAIKRWLDGNINIKNTDQKLVALSRYFYKTPLKSDIQGYKQELIERNALSLKDIGIFKQDKAKSETSSSQPELPAYKMP